MSYLETKTGVFSIAAATVASAIAFLAYKYPDCGAFDTPHESIPYRKGVPILGNLPRIAANVDRYHEYVVEVYEELNSLTFRSTQILIPNIINTCDPRNIEHILKTNFENYEKGEHFSAMLHDLLGEGIFNSDGEAWRVQRKVASRIFHVKNFRDRFTSVFLDEINIASKHIFDQAADSNTVIDFQDIMYRFTIDSFAQLGFSVQLNSLLGKADFAQSFDAIQMHAFRRFLVPFVDTIEGIKHYTNYWGKTKSIKQHLENINTFANNIIQERKNNTRSQEDPNADLLDRFLHSKKLNGSSYSDQDLRDAILNFMVAGRDTTAVSLSWTFYNVIMHPRVEEKILKEVRQYITDDIETDPVGLYEVVQKMTYTHAVFYEVLRLYPSVPGNQKGALADDIWPDGTHVKKGDQVSWQSFAEGRMTSIWGEDAKEFKPERWIDPADGSLIRVSPFKWSAFNAGPRVCLGQNLAILEAVIAISILIKRYKFTRAPGHQVVILNLLTIAMKDGMKITVEKRDTILK